MRLKFFKYKLYYHGGVPERWVYVRLPAGETAKKFFDGLSKYYSFHESNFLRLSYQPVARPPTWWLKSQILGMSNQATNLAQMVERYEKLCEQ